MRDAEVSLKGTGEDQKSVGYIKGPAPAEKENGGTNIVGGDTGFCVSTPPFLSHLAQNFGVRGRRALGGAGFRPKCGERASLGCTHVRHAENRAPIFL